MMKQDGRRLSPGGLFNALTDHSVITPIKVTHQLVMEVWYSIFGEDVGGNPLPEGGQSQLRVLRVDKPVTVPSCAFIPEVVELPSCKEAHFH